MIGEDPVNLELQVVRGRLRNPLSLLIIPLEFGCSDFGVISGSDKEGWAIYLERGLLARKMKVVFYAFIFVLKNLGRLQRFLGGAVIGNQILNSPT